MADTTQNKKVIKLSERDTLKIELEEKNGKSTGKYLEFDVESLSYPLKLNECLKMLKKANSDLNVELMLIRKRQDKKGKYVLSKNEEDEQKAYQKFYEKGMEAYDSFFGENGCKKILNGREPYYRMFDEFDRIANEILPMLKVKSEEIKKEIKNKYSNKEKNVLE